VILLNNKNKIKKNLDRITTTYNSKINFKKY